ncbi:MAG TPA: hypothetical protein VIV56_01885 [Gemmatimonadales bacterium]
MIEAAARKLAALDGGGDNWEHREDAARQGWREDATAVLAAALEVCEVRVDSQIYGVWYPDPKAEAATARRLVIICPAESVETEKGNNE